jgi:hypothetical protein
MMRNNVERLGEHITAAPARKLRRLSSMPSRSWCGSSNGRMAPLSSRRTATLLTIASPSG